MIFFFRLPAWTEFEQTTAWMYSFLVEPCYLADKELRKIIFHGQPGLDPKAVLETKGSVRKEKKTFKAR